MAEQNLNQIFARFAREGEPEDLALVFDALAPRLLLVALRMARQQVEAEDLVQETFMRVLEGARLNDENRPLLPWLVTILTNEFRERLRRPKLVERRKPEETADPRPPEEIIALSETAEMIEARVDELPERFRAAIRLRLLHGLKGPEIARVLEIPEATVRTRIHRGLELLKKGLPPGRATVLVLARLAPGDPIAEEPFEFFTYERGLYVAIVKSAGPWRLRATHPLLEMVEQELRFKKDERRKDLTILAQRRACTAALELDLVAHDGGPGEACLEDARPDESYEAVILRVRGRSTIAMPEGRHELAFTSTDSFDLLCFHEFEQLHDELRRMTFEFERGGKLQIELLGAELSEERRWPRVMIEGRRLGEDIDEGFVRLA